MLNSADNMLESRVCLFEENSRTWVRFFVRGNLLIVTDAEKHGVHSEFFTLHGATCIHRKKRLVPHRLYALLIIALSLVAMALMFWFCLAMPLALYVAMGLGVLAMVSLAVAPFTLLFPINTVHLSLNGPEEARTLVLRHQIGEDPALDNFIASIPTRTTKSHPHIPAPAIALVDDWLHVFPIRYVTGTTIQLSTLIVTILGLLAYALEFFDVAIPWPLYLGTVMILPLVLVICFMGYQLYSGNVTWRGLALRKQAIGSIKRGEFSVTEAALIALLTQNPDDSEARCLLAHLCVLQGAYAAAQGCISQLKEGDREQGDAFLGSMQLIVDLETLGAEETYALHQRLLQESM